ncbi:MAG: DUF2599 domain-containing protein [Actinomycetaceae bacterium]|nr:DUF2599 domain-containing protein [Actinomycetaceae bacterium]
MSVWGVAVLAGTAYPRVYGIGQSVMRNQGWKEWVAKYPAITNKATLRQQYNCHVASGIYGLPIAKTYNLERFRSNNSTWGWKVWSHKCNW